MWSEACLILSGEGAGGLAISFCSCIPFRVTAACFHQHVWVIRGATAALIHSHPSSNGPALPVRRRWPDDAFQPARSGGS